MQGAEAARSRGGVDRVDQSKSEELSGLNLQKLKEQGQKINPRIWSLSQYNPIGIKWGVGLKYTIYIHISRPSYT